MTYLGAGPAPIAVIEHALSHAPILVAVDGGVLHAAVAGRVPDRIIGDLDGQPSVLPADFADVPITHIQEQDSTDFDKALRSIASDLAIGVGFLGGRVDHELACFSSLAQHPHRKCILLSETDAVTLLPPKGTIDLPLSTRLSLFPLAPVTLWTDGVRWPLEGETLDPLGRIGTSNETIANRVSLRCDRAACLLIVPASELPALIGFQQQSIGWSEIADGSST